MADAVTTNVIDQTDSYYVVHLTNISDGTGESAVSKVDKSTLRISTTGAEPVSLDIEQVRWCIQGFTSVRILWDHTTDDVALVLAASGYDDFRGIDRSLENKADPTSKERTTAGLKDPRSSGGTGDILVTTNGGSSGASYDITLWLKKTAS